MAVEIRIYYEDTDLGGVVYYANYLRYFERSRTEFLRDRGVSLADWHRRGVVFTVTRAEVEYRRPAHYGDILTAETTVEEVRPVRFTLGCQIRRQESGEVLVEGRTTLACLEAATGRPLALPEEIRRALAGD